jgi:molybdenum cofactor cytidylyltransferase
MTGMPILCGLILAAGDSSRMGRDKALLPWPPAPLDEAPATGETLLSATIRALQPFTREVIVVAGKNLKALAPIVSACGAILAHNPQPGRGQFSSLQIGLRRVVELGCEAVVLTPVDAPPLQKSTLNCLLAAFDAALSEGRWAVAPEYNGKHGHPLWASRPLIEAFLQAPVTSNARAVRHAHAQSIEYLPVDDALVGAEMNTPAEYAALARTSSR